MLTCHKCNTCFESRPEANAHYKSKWHEYNLMRALNFLPPVTEASYDAAYQQLLSNQENAQLPESYSCLPCRKSFSSFGSYNSHLKSRRHASTLASNAKANHAEPLAPSEERQKISISVADEPSSDCSEWEDVGGDDPPRIVDEANRKNLETCILAGQWPCLLCQKRCPSPASAVRHLCQKHSVVVPHIDACNLAVLYDVLAVVVACQLRCLQCGKQHNTLPACRRHMFQKPHLTVPLPGPYDFCYRWSELEKSLILAATATSEGVVPGEEYPTQKLQLPTGSVVANRRAGRPRRAKATVATVAVKRRVVGPKQAHGGGMAVAVLPKKRRELYGRKPAHAKRPVAKNLHKVVLPC